jgi:hypothetical protein
MNELEAVYELIRSLKAQTDALNNLADSNHALAKSNERLVDFLADEDSETL